MTFLFHLPTKKWAIIFLATLSLTTGTFVHAYNVKYSLNDTQNFAHDDSNIPRNIIAHLVLGRCYIQADCRFRDGKTLAKDTQKGLEHLEKVANQSYATDSEYEKRFQQDVRTIFQYVLADCYYNGKYGVQQDINKAHHYAEMAANNNHPSAKLLLAKMYFKKDIETDPSDISIPFRYLHEACNVSVLEACEIEEELKKACNDGMQEACEPKEEAYMEKNKHSNNISE